MKWIDLVTWMVASHLTGSVSDELSSRVQRTQLVCEDFWFLNTVVFVVLVGYGGRVL